MLLPLGLVLATVGGLGSYYEASDDTSLAWLFSGVLALKPVASVPLYFHGYGYLLAAAYTVAPGIPWFGVLLGGLLSAATVLTFAVLDRLLRPHLRPPALVLALVAFYGVAWLEHWLWFSYVRVALVLAGAAVLFAAQRPGRRGALAVGLVGLGAAWLMRPSLGVLGLVAALPAAVGLAGGWRRAVPVLGCAAVGLGLAAGVAAGLRTPTQAHTQVRDQYFARILDFDQLRPQPRTAADSLGTAAIGLWLLGDSTVVNEALCRRVYRFDARDFWGREVPAKLRLRAGLLVRDYFPLLLALAATGFGLVRRRGSQGWFWLVQMGFSGVLVVFAGVLKLPPRLELPLLTFWLLANLAWLLPPLAEDVQPGKHAAAGTHFLATYRLMGLALALVAGLLYGYKTWHRYHLLSAERHGHERALQVIERAGAGRLLVLAGTNDLLKSLSPFRSYAPARVPLLMLSGWPSHDASQGPLRRSLSGAADQTECLRRLARADTGLPPRWVLTPEAAGWLARRSRLSGGRALSFTRANGFFVDSSLFVYDVRVQRLPVPKNALF